MNTIQTLLTDHLDIWTAADTEKKSGRGRSSGNAASVYGIKKLRELILELAVRGKLVPQDANDEPASVLLRRIQTEKSKLIAEGKIKKDKLLATVTEDEKPFELPQGWVWTRLGEITNFGATEKLDSISDDTWVLDLEDVEKDTSKLLQKFRFSERRSLSDKNSFKSGDVLYGKLRPYLNKVVVADEAGVCTTEILPFRCYGPFDSHYFKDALKSPYFISYVNARSYGMKMPRLGTEDGRRACFPLPPLDEQHRIVAKVDELMAFCDQLEQRQTESQEAHQNLVEALLGTLTRVESQQEFSAAWARIASHFDTLFTTEASIAQLKQTILQLAVMGKLVPQDPDDPPASQLLNEIEAEKKRLVKEGKIKAPKPLAEIATEEVPYALPQGWEWVRLGSISSKITDGDHKTPPRISEGFRLLSAKNVRDGYLDFDNCDLISEQHYLKSRERCCPDVGDLLIVSVGGTIGRTSLVPDDSDFALVRSVALIKPLLFDSAYLKLAMDSSLLQSSIHARKRGGAQPCLYLSEIELFIFSFPPLAEQHRIVAKVDELMALCNALRARIKDAQEIQLHLADAIVEQAVC